MYFTGLQTPLRVNTSLKHCKGLNIRSIGAEADYTKSMQILTKTEETSMQWIRADHVETARILQLRIPRPKNSQH